LRRSRNDADRPYGLYAELRKHAPAFFSEEMNAWLLTKYADVSWAMKHPHHPTREQRPGSVPF
jgi:cytochrome P450